MLKKDSTDDWRAAVKFTVDAFSQFTSTGNHSGDHPDACSTEWAQCEKHCALADVTFVNNLVGADGVCFGHDRHRILIDWDDSTTDWLERAIAHEMGHGVGLDHQGHISPQLMREGWLQPTDTELLETDVDNYDGD